MLGLDLTHLDPYPDLDIAMNTGWQIQASRRDPSLAVSRFSGIPNSFIKHLISEDKSLYFL